MSESRPGAGGSAGSGGAAGSGGSRGVRDLTADATPDRSLPGDPAALERLIDQRREHLAATVDELARRAQPRQLARQGAEQTAARLRAAVYTPDAGLRVERVAAIGAAVLTLIALAVWRRRSR